MSNESTPRIEPSKHSTPQVDEKLAQVQDKVDHAPGAGSPAIKPNTDLRDDGKPASDTPENPRL